MKIDISTMFISLAFLSCNKPETPPNEEEVIKIISDFFYPEIQSLYSIST